MKEGGEVGVFRGKSGTWFVRVRVETGRVTFYIILRPQRDGLRGRVITGWGEQDGSRVERHVDLKGRRGNRGTVREESRRTEGSVLHFDFKL